MPRTKLILDGLWYQLCPSFSPALLKRARLPLTTKRRPLPCHNASVHVSKPRSLPTPKCPYSTRTEPQGEAEPHDVVAYSSPVTDAPSEQKDPRAPPPRGRNRTFRRNAWAGKSKVKTNSGAVRRLRKMTVDRLEVKLKTLATLAPDIVGTARTLDLLIRAHRVRPDVRHYRAMILANCDPLRGCARQVRALLGEMEPNGIPVDSGTLHAALQVCMSWTVSRDSDADVS